MDMRSMQARLTAPAGRRLCARGGAPDSGLCGVLPPASGCCRGGLAAPLAAGAPGDGCALLQPLRPSSQVLMSSCSLAASLPCCCWRSRSADPGAVPAAPPATSSTARSRLLLSLPHFCGVPAQTGGVPTPGALLPLDASCSSTAAGAAPACSARSAAAHCCPACLSCRWLGCCCCCCCCTAPVAVHWWASRHMSTCRAGSKPRHSVSHQTAPATQPLLSRPAWPFTP